MRLIKMLGLAVVAAIASMAFIGASSALASGSTTLCKLNELTCLSKAHLESLKVANAKENLYTGTVEALSTNPVLLGVLDVECSHSKVVSNALGLAAPLVIHVSELTFTGCSCTVNVNDKTGTIKGLKTGANTATGTAEGFAVLVQCGFVDCVFGGAGEGAVAEGGNPATIHAEEVELEKLSGGFFCGSAGFWDADYNVTSPNPIYIGA